MKKTILFCGIHQETASFNPVPSTAEHFKRFVWEWEGQHMLQRFRGNKSSMGGLIAAAEDAGFAVRGSAYLRAYSGGPVQQSLVEEFLDRVRQDLAEIGPVDGVLLALHGATQSDASDDVCGDVLTAVRAMVGEEVVIAASCDLHANVTARMMRAADFVSGYQTYPHLDAYETGYRAGSLAARKLRGEPTHMAWTTLPQMAPAHGYTTEAGGLKKLMDRAHAMVAEGKILDFSIFQVQPWLDVDCSGSAVVVAAETEEAAKAAAADLAAEEFALRAELQGPKLWSIEETIRAALENPEDKPVVLVDSADSPGAGSNGDSAAVIEGLLPYRDTLRAAVAVVDPAAVAKAFALGVGGKADFTLGGSIAPELSAPVTVPDCTVRSLHSGEFIIQGRASHGQTVSMGRSAVLQTGQLQIVVCHSCSNSRDLQAFRGVGVEPTLCRLVSVKACTSFRANYEPIAAQICNADTPGAAGVDLLRLPFKRIPKPFYPFQETDETMIPASVCLR